jgi:hypothetical protein
MKHPPIQYPDTTAKREVEAFIKNRMKKVRVARSQQVTDLI